MADLEPTLARLDHRLRDRPVRAAPSDHQHLPLGIEEGLRRLQPIGDAADLLGAGAHHLLVIVRVVADVAGERILLQAADAVLETGSSRNGPGPGKLLVALVRHEPGRIGGEIRFDLRKAVHVRKEPRLAAVRERSVRQDDDRRPAIDGDPAGLVGRFEAVGWGAGGEHRDRTLAVASIDSLEEVRLLRLGGQSGRRPAALHVDDHQRELGHQGETHRFRLERDPRTARAGDAERAGERRADGRGDRRDLVLRLERRQLEAPVLGELVQDVARRSDRVAAVEEPQARLLRRRDETERQRAVPGDVAVFAGLEPRRLYGIGGVQSLDGLAVVVACLEGAHVRLRQRRALLEALSDGLLLALDVAGVDPEHQAERVEVLAPAGVLRGDAGALHGLSDQVLEVHLDHLVVLQGAVGERIRLPPRAIEVGLLEARLVEDEQAAALQVRQMHFQGRRVHRHQRVRLVARRIHLVRRKLDLVAGDARRRSRGGADFRRVIREGGQVIAVQRRLARELRPGELHPIARVARESHDGVLQVDVGAGSGNRHRFASWGEPT